MESVSRGVQVVRTREGWKSLAKEVKKAVPAGKVAVFCREGREMEDAVAALSLEGYAVHRVSVGDDFVMRYVPLSESDYPECITAAVGVGGLSAIETAKAFSARRSVPTFLFPTDLSGLSAYKEDAGFAMARHLIDVPASLFTALCDDMLLTSAEGLRAGLGRLMARAVEVLDGAYADLVEGKGDLSMAAGVVRSALSEWKKEGADRTKRIVNSVLKLEEGVRRYSLPTVKSATTFAFLAARKEGGRYDEHLFSAAYTLLSLYRYYLGNMPLECAVPADRAEELGRLATQCGMDCTGHLAQEDVSYAAGYRGKQYLTAEYKEDYLDALSEEAFPVSELCRAYRRAAKKGERAPLSSESLLSLLSLTGSAVSGYALIKHIELSGLIEPLRDSA